MGNLLAVHIADGVLAWPWLAVGWLMVGALLGVASRRISNEEAPTIALLAAAFFVASQIHLPVPPSSSVHLLLNALLGMILGVRAALAIFLGLLLQALLFQHGGLYALGANATIMILPALLARGLLRLGQHLGWLDRPPWRMALGFGIGFLTVLATLLLHYLTLAYGTQSPENLRRLAQFDFIFHLPILAIESLITMTTLDFVWRVKPGMLGLVLTERGRPSIPNSRSSDQP